MILNIEGRVYDLRLRADRRRFTHVEVGYAIAAQVKALREERGWTQRELAARAGMKQPALNRLENTITLHCSIKTLCRIAAAFDLALTVRFAAWSVVLCEYGAFVVADADALGATPPAAGGEGGS